MVPAIAEVAPLKFLRLSHLEPYNVRYSYASSCPWFRVTSWRSIKTAALEVEGFSIIARTKKVEKNGKVTKAASQPVFVTVPATTKVIKAEKAPL